MDLAAEVRFTAVVQVSLPEAEAGPGASMYVADPGQELFVEVYGTAPPLPEPEVEILRFSTSGGLRHQLDQAPELEENLKALGRASISTELHECDYGYGLLCVRPELAGKVLVALHARQRLKRALPTDRNGGRLLSSEVVVSHDLKARVVLAATRAYHQTGQTGRGAGKHRYLKHQYCEPLELTDVPDEVLGPPAKRVKLSDADSSCTVSTTAARGVQRPRPLGR